MEMSSQLYEALTSLCSGSFFDLHIAPDGALITVKGDGKNHFTRVLCRGWGDLDPEAKAAFIFEWITSAARECRLAAGSTPSALSDVA